MTVETALSEAASLFSIGELQSVVPATKGLGNENYFVTTTQGEFVLRILKTQTMDGVINEVVIGERLQGVGVPAAELLHVDGHPYCRVGDRTITCSKRINGEHPDEGTALLAYQIGVTLALFHAAVMDLPQPTHSWLAPDEFLEEVSKLPECIEADDIKTRAHDTADIFSIGLPTGIIHGDLHLGNLLLTPEGNIAVFDFEETGRSALVLDLATSAMSLMNQKLEADSSIVSSLIEGYESLRPLTPLERKSFPNASLYVGAVSAAWLYNQGYTQYANDALESSRRAAAQSF